MQKLLPIVVVVIFAIAVIFITSPGGLFWGKGGKFADEPNGIIEDSKPNKGKGKKSEPIESFQVNELENLGSNNKVSNLAFIEKEGVSSLGFIGIDKTVTALGFLDMVGIESVSNLVFLNGEEDSDADENNIQQFKELLI